MTLIASSLSRTLSRNPSYTAMRVGSPKLFQFTVAEAKTHEWLCHALKQYREQEATEKQEQAA